MFNPATVDYNGLNVFTRILKNGKGEIHVKLRNGTLICPVYKEAEDDTCEDAFFANGYRYCWNLNGKSVTSSDYDMMELSHIETNGRVWTFAA
jgi:hypothetical protein